jgi:hypothetical protein
MVRSSKSPEGDIMRKAATVALLILAVLLVSAAPSLAWGRTHVFIGVGPGFWYGPYPYWYYPPPYYGYAPPPVVVQEPPVYVQQPAVSGPPAPPVPSAQTQSAEAFWYYCPSGKGYYPSVQTCPEPWVKVPPRQD